MKKNDHELEGSCIFCHRGEPTAHTCSTCVQKLLLTPAERTQEIINENNSMQSENKIKYLNQLAGKEGGTIYVRETKQFRSSVVRKRPVRKIKFTRRSNHRTKSAAL